MRIINLVVLLIVVIAMTTACTEKEEMTFHQPDSTNLSTLETTRSIYVDQLGEGPSNIAPEKQRQLAKLADKVAAEFTFKGKAEIGPSEIIFKPDEKTEGCCKILSVVQQPNPTLIGARVGDRKMEGVETWYLIYRGYDQETGNLLTEWFYEIESQTCGSNFGWNYWFGVPVNPDWNLHPTCPDPLARAEFYLFKEYPEEPEPLPCTAIRKVYPIRMDSTNPADPACADDDISDY